MSDFQSFLNEYIVFVLPTFSSQDVFNIVVFPSLNTIVVFLLQYISYEYVPLKRQVAFLHRSYSSMSQKIERTYIVRTLAARCESAFGEATDRLMNTQWDRRNEFGTCH